MSTLARGQTSSCAAPLLRFIAQIDGTLVDIASLEFQVFDTTSPEKRGAPVQVFPVTVGQRAAVAVAVPCPNGDRLGTGQYVARWTVPSDEPLGVHAIQWFWRTDGG